MKNYKIIKSLLKGQKRLQPTGMMISFFIVLLLAYNSAIAQSRFSASAPKQVPENQNFNLSYTLENANGSNLKLPVLNDFTLLGGPSFSSNMDLVSGRSSVTYSYVLRPKKQGTFKLGKGMIDVNGTIIESNELTIQVTPPSSKPQNQQGQNPFYDPFGQGQGQNQQPQPSDAELQKQLKDEVFVKVVLSKNSVYKGEMLTATYKLYFSRNLSGYNLSKSPPLDGFWSKDIELDPRRRPTLENVNGKKYTVLDILKYNLYPQRSGTLQVAPAEINTNVQVPASNSNDPFGGFFGGQVRNVPLSIKSGSASVVVKELPESGKPKDFGGAVGKFNFSTNLSAKEAKTDNPVTYTIKVSGEGNLSLIEAPKVELPTGFEVYDPKVKEDISNTAAGMSGSKQYDYLIIPRQPGDYKIGVESFSYFDPSTGKYFTITPPQYPLKVTGEPSKNLNTNSGSYTNKQDVSLLGEDIRYIKIPTPVFDKTINEFFGSAGFITMYCLPFFAFVGLVAMRRRNETLAADITGSKRRKATRLAKRRLHSAEKHLAQNDKKNFYDEVSRAIWGYLGDKLNIDMAELSKDSVDEKLLSKNVTPETISKLQALIRSCELSLYASSGNSEMKNDYDAALNLIADLEDEIRK